MRRIDEIRLAHGRHSGLKCAVCFMLAEVDRAGAEPRVAAAERAASEAREGRLAAERETQHYRDRVATLLADLSVAKRVDEAARQQAAGALAAAEMRIEQADQSLAATTARFASLQSKLAELRVGLQALTRTPRNKRILADFDAAMESVT